MVTKNVAVNFALLMQNGPQQTSKEITAVPSPVLSGNLLSLNYSEARLFYVSNCVFSSDKASPNSFTASAVL